MGGNSCKDVLVEVVWEFVKDGVMLELLVECELNCYGGEFYILLLGIYQMEDVVVFYKLIVDFVVLVCSLFVNKGNEGFVQFICYVVDFGQYFILIFDWVQKVKFIGLVVGYY